ncbi:uncharacterized protein LOC126827899 [Patella vulgata]|uniref:uncharacterized protein LOC126827899 n=1 Tax=Patella vulgata TaxID=6465 RepID=UPI0024A905C9|nr:uncharacterized protein LOC126827899 [Patella vulgata]
MKLVSPPPKNVAVKRELKHYLDRKFETEIASLKTEINGASRSVKRLKDDKEHVWRGNGNKDQFLYNSDLADNLTQALWGINVGKLDHTKYIIHDCLGGWMAEWLACARCLIQSVIESTGVVSNPRLYVARSRVACPTSWVTPFLPLSHDCLAKRSKLIKIADSFDAGWETVKLYETHPLADDSEDKKINRAEASALRKKKERVTKLKSKRK